VKYSQILELLGLITAYDRTEFPPDAASAWHRALSSVDFDDAAQAVTEHYTVLGSRDSSGAVKRMIPADVKGRATGIRQARERAQRRQLPAGSPETVGTAAQSARARALLREALERAAAHSKNVHARDRQPVAL